VRSRVNERFRKAFDSLPEAVQRKARDAYARWRAVGIRDDDDMIWFWIGSHAEYDKLIAQLRKRG